MSTTDRPPGTPEFSPQPSTVEGQAKPGENQAAPLCRWPRCLTPDRQDALADEVMRQLAGEPPSPPEPDQREVCGCREDAPGCSGAGAETEPNTCTCPCEGCKHHCGAHQEPDDTDLTEQDIDRMMAEGTPVQLADPPAPAPTAGPPTPRRPLMPDSPDLCETVAAAMAHVAGSRAFKEPDLAWDHARSVWLRQADAAIAAIQGGYVPPPPGSDEAKLPDHLLAVVDVPPYLSTACQAAQALTEAIPAHLDMADELGRWAGRMHTQCRTTHKFTMQSCVCGCGHPGRADTEET